jgi:hypothetical protein
MSKSKTVHETPMEPAFESVPVDDGMDELNAIEGELLGADGASVNDESKQKDKDYSEKVEPYDRQIASMCAMLSMGVGAYFSKRKKSDIWLVAEEEAELFGVSAAKVIDYYFPDQKYSPLIEFGIVAGFMIGGRVAADQMSRGPSVESEGNNGES